jgi:nitroimidazol reductase NimA-like FMN-containing flavoprotein (pyridoxamine 5'-phosphate oxidase superfamily)
MVRISAEIGAEMAETEQESFLNSRGHGVLSLAADNRGYGIPVSYGFDESDRRIVLEFVNGTESKKAEFAEVSTEVTLTVYDYEAVDRWESVIVTGELREIPDTDVSDRFAFRFFAQADDATGELRGADLDDVTRQWYAIEVSDITGRHGGVLMHTESANDDR